MPDLPNVENFAQKTHDVQTLLANLQDQVNQLKDRDAELDNRMDVVKTTTQDKLSSVENIINENKDGLTNIRDHIEHNYENLGNSMQSLTNTQNHGRATLAGGLQDSHTKLNSLQEVLAQNQEAVRLGTGQVGQQLQNLQTNGQQGTQSLSLQAVGAGEVIGQMKELLAETEKRHEEQLQELRDHMDQRIKDVESRVDEAEKQTEEKKKDSEDKADETSKSTGSSTGTMTGNTGGMVNGVQGYFVSMIDQQIAATMMQIQFLYTLWDNFMISTSDFLFELDFLMSDLAMLQTLKASAMMGPMGGPFGGGGFMPPI